MSGQGIPRRDYHDHRAQTADPGRESNTSWSPSTPTTASPSCITCPGRCRHAVVRDDNHVADSKRSTSTAAVGKGSVHVNQPRLYCLTLPMKECALLTTIGWDEEYHILFGRQRKSSVPRCAITSRFRLRESNFQAIGSWEQGDTALPAVRSRAETSRCRQATRDSSWLHDAALARSANRDLIRARWCRERQGQRRHLGGHLPR